MLDEIARLSKSDSRSANSMRSACAAWSGAGRGRRNRLAARPRLRNCGPMLVLPADGSANEAQASPSRCSGRSTSWLKEKQSKVLPPGVATAGNVDLDESRCVFFCSPVLGMRGTRLTGVLEILRFPGAGPTDAGSLPGLPGSGVRTGRRFPSPPTARQLPPVVRGPETHPGLCPAGSPQPGLKETAFTVANEGRRLIGCDRVSVLVRRGTRCRLVAVSGVATVNRRANAVRALERLATGMLARANRCGTRTRKANVLRNWNAARTRISTNRTPADWRSCRCVCSRSKRTRTLAPGGRRAGRGTVLRHVGRALALERDGG